MSTEDKKAEAELSEFLNERQMKIKNIGQNLAKSINANIQIHQQIMAPFVETEQDARLGLVCITSALLANIDEVINEMLSPGSPEELMELFKEFTTLDKDHFVRCWNHYQEQKAERAMEEKSKSNESSH